MITADARAQAPYAASAEAYRRAGWDWVLPLPPCEKGPPPPGWTGRHDVIPSGADIWAWIETSGVGNVALRVPPDVIGLDVDAYGGKVGGQTWREACARLGTPPGTWHSSARGADSGIWFYRVPAGLTWAGQIGPDVEIIQHRHRYAVVSPSVHPGGGVYRWRDPDGVLNLAVVPCPDDLATLPPAWVQEFSQVPGTASEAVRSELTPEHVSVVADDGPVCRLMRHVVLDAEAHLRSGSRHDGGLRVVMHLVRLRAEGHTGLREALNTVMRLWLSAVTSAGEGQRDEASAVSEWRRLLGGALALGQPPASGDPCTDDLAGLLPAGWQGEYLAELGAGGAELGAAPQRVPEALGIPAPAVPSGAPRREPIQGEPESPEGGFPGEGSETLGSSEVVPPGPLVLGDPQLDFISEMPPLAISARGPGGEMDATAEALRAQARADRIRIEVDKLEVRREAKRLVDAAEHAAAWRVPPTDELPVWLLEPDEPILFRVEECIPEGSNVLLTAQYKSGKTTLVNHLAMCLADQMPFLGRFGVEGSAGRVAMWNYEVSRAQYLRWMRDLGIVASDMISVLNLRGYTMPLISEPVMVWAVEWLKRREVDTWIIDPFARAFIGCGDSENDNSAVGRFLDVLDQIKDRAGVGQLVLPTHTGRASADVGTERARGATRLDDWADVRWHLNVVEEGDETNAAGRYWRATGRDVEVPEGRLSWDPITRFLRLEDGGRERPTKGRRGFAPSSPNPSNDVMAALIDAGQPLTQNALVRMVKLRKADMPGVLAGLLSQGLIRCQDGPRGSNLYSPTGSDQGGNQ